MFKVGDKVFDIMRQKWGVVRAVKKPNQNGVGVSVSFDDDVYWHNYDSDGVRYGGFKTPSLTFREFYLPDGLQERPRWRAEKCEHYFYVYTTGEVLIAHDSFSDYDNELFNCGNYFETEEEAMESKFYKVFHEEV